MIAPSPQHSDVAHATRAAPQSSSAPFASSSTGVAASEAVVADDAPLAPPSPPPPLAPQPEGATDAVVTADTERAPRGPASARNADESPAAPAHVTRVCDEDAEEDEEDGGGDDSGCDDVADVVVIAAPEAAAATAAATPRRRTGDGEASRRRPTRNDVVRRRSGHGLSGGGRFRPVRGAGASGLPSLIPNTHKKKKKTRRNTADCTQTHKSNKHLRNIFSQKA